MDEDTGPALYPNRGGPDRPSGVSRRRLLTGSAAAGAAVTAGCVGGDSTGDGSSQDAVFVFNTGDGTVSVLDPATDEVLTTRAVGLSSSFPANQFAPNLTTEPDDPLWLNVDRGVRAVAVGPLSTVAAVETGSGFNWQELTPDGRHLLVSAREPAHRQLRIDADRGSETFGEVTAEIDRTPEGGRGGRDGPGPCDLSVHPDGEFVYVPDLFGDTLTVLRVDPFEVVTQVPVEPVGEGPAAPWMGTVAPDGRRLLVEHNEGPGTESVWDLSEPAAPAEVARLTVEDGLGEGALTSEIGPDSETGYVFTPGTDDVTVIDLVAGSVEGRIDVGGSAFTGSWDPDHETLYVPVQTADEVAVIDHAAREVTATVPVGDAPYGATAARVRPDPEPGAALWAAAAALGLDGRRGTTYCIGNCACGHDP
jgi:YVTN family beta-propeller protein